MLILGLKLKIGPKSGSDLCVTSGWFCSFYPKLSVDRANAWRLLCGPSGLSLHIVLRVRAWLRYLEKSRPPEQTQAHFAIVSLGTPSLCMRIAPPCCMSSNSAAIAVGIFMNSPCSFARSIHSEQAAKRSWWTLFSLSHVDGPKHLLR